MAEDKDRSKLIEKIQHFRLIDDTYFNNFMDDNFSGMQLFLRIIMEDSELEVLRIQTQREGMLLELNMTSRCNVATPVQRRNALASTAACWTR